MKARPRTPAPPAALAILGILTVLAMAALACRSAPEAAEREIVALVGDLLEAVRAGVPARVSAFYMHDPRYERQTPGAPSGADSERVRLADFCSTPGFEYDPPSPQVALLRHRAVVTFDLTYRFDREGRKVERVARVTLFVERRPQGWGILRDSVAFPADGGPGRDSSG